MQYSRLLLVLVVWMATLGSLRAQQATAQVRATADKIISILKDQSLQGDAKKAERHRLIRQELEDRFDWTSICRSSLGRHWTKLNHEEQSEFMNLFKDFLEHTYMDRIEPYYDQLERIEYHGERIADTNYASVKTTVVTKQKAEHP